MESAAITNEIIKRMQTARAPLRRKHTKRHVKPFGSSGILTVRDANRSIVDRKAEEAIKEEKRLAKAWEKAHGKPPIKRDMQESETSIEAAKAAEAAGEIFSLIRIQCVDK